MSIVEKLTEGIVNRDMKREGEALLNKWTQTGLLEGLEALEDLARLRYTTSHPLDMDAELIAAHRDSEVLMPYLHLPIQSGSNDILAAMNRRHRVDDYLRVVDLLRNARPDIALSSDFIVGFPGETVADFESTLALVRNVGYATAYSFKYSARPGTPSAALENQIEEHVRVERLAELQSLINSQQTSFNQHTVGLEFDVLLERRGRFDGQLIGRSPYNQAVHVNNAVKGNCKIGDITRVRVDEAGPHSVAARVAASANAA